MKTICWDIDETLNNLIYEWINYWKKHHKECNTTYEEINEYCLSNVLNIHDDEIGLFFDKFKVEGYFDKLEPNKKILDWLKKYGNNFYHIAVTSSSLDTSHISANWVLKHFGKWIRTFHVIPSYRINDTSFIFDKTKADYIKRMNNIDIFIDDCQENINEIKKVVNNITCFTIKKPWNKGVELEEILNYLTSEIDNETF